MAQQNVQSDVYGELMSCLDDISTSMIEEELRDFQYQPEIQLHPSMDHYISEFCLEHFGEADDQPSTELTLDSGAEYSQIDQPSPDQVSSPTPDQSIATSLYYPELLEDHLDNLASLCDLPDLSPEEVDSVCGSMDYQDLGSPCSLLRSPDSGYGSGNSSPDTSFSLPEQSAGLVKQLDWNSLLSGIESATAVQTDYAPPTAAHNPQCFNFPRVPTYQCHMETTPRDPSPAYIAHLRGNTLYTVLSSTGPEKPTDSYVAMIAKAIMASKDGRLMLCDIYQFILDNYPFYQTAKNSWRNSVRHNLSTNACFIKCGRARNGKGFYWGIHAACLEAFQSGDFDRRQARRQVQHSVTLRNHFPPAPTQKCSLELNGYSFW